MVGAGQIPAAEGPRNVVPAALLLSGFGSGTKYVFQTTAPVFASNALRLPRNVQHSYRGLFPCVSSNDDTPTYSRFSYKVTAPVMRESG